MALYRIGPDDFFTGGDLRSDAETLDGMVDALSKSFGEAGASTRAGRDLADSWITFYLDWKEYYQREFSPWSSDLLTALNDANRDQLIQWESRFADMAGLLKAKDVSSAYVNVQLSAGAPDTVKSLFAGFQKGLKSLGLGSLGWVAGMLILIAVGFAVWHFGVRMV